MNIAFFTNYIYTPHLETELELIQNHLDQGDVVYHFVCDAHLLSCDTNATHDLLQCEYCIAKRVKGQQLLENKKNYFPVRISKFHNKAAYPFPQLSFSTIKELRNYKIDNFELGDAALSSLVSIVREPEPDLEANRKLLSDIILSTNYMYYYFLKELAERKIDVFYIFNGRFAVDRAALRASQKLGVKALVHERGSDYKTYELFDNVLPHEIMPFTQRTKEFWADFPADEVKKNEIAHNFYQERVVGKEQGWISFVKEQKTGLLPENWNTEDDNIVIFTSSEDEYVSIGEEWDLGVFISQNALVLKLKDEPKLSGKKIWVRLHPNMRLMDKKYLERTYETLQGGIGLILPDSLINSYDLINSASKVVTFGSTVGIEATYWGKSSILVGPAFYMHFEVTYNPQTYEELVDLLLIEDLKAMPQDNTLMYGFYVLKFGIPFSIFKPENLFVGTFKNVDLEKVFDYYKWRKRINIRGLHRIYNQLNKFNRILLLKKYV